MFKWIAVFCMALLLVVCHVTPIPTLALAAPTPIPATPTLAPPPYTAGDMPLLQAWVGLLKDLLTALSASVVAIVAIVGLNAWRKQLKGKTEYALARRILHAVYKLRDAIRFVRRPIMPSEEISAAMKEVGIELDPRDHKFHSEGQHATYQIRWKRIVEAANDLEVEALEAEAIWGQETKDTIMAVFKSVHSLFVALGSYFRHQSNSSASILGPGTAPTFEKIVFNMGDETHPDEFTKELNSRIEAIETLLRPHLKI